MRLLLARLIVVTCVTAVLAGCQSDPPPSPDAAATLAGTERMAHVLDSIRTDAFRHPEDYYHLNRLNAERLAKELETATPRERVSLQYTYAFQLLNAGETEAAIREISDLIQTVRASPSRITRQSKPLFDLLGIAYMRMAEQQNCIDNHTAASCILPIREEGVHTRRGGSERAIRVYNNMLRSFRNDLQARWLLNIAYMTLGAYPDDVPGRVRIDGIEAEDDGPIRRFVDVVPTVGASHRGLAGGVSVDDFDDDGFLDVLTTSYGLGDSMKVYRNDGQGGFEDVTSRSGLDRIRGGLNTVHADYDNDGDRDVFVLRGAWLGENGRHPNSLLRNDGDGTFTDVTFEADLDAYHPTQVAAWADVNRDGFVDLFVGNESNAEINFLTGQTTALDSTRHPSALYLNDGDGTFTNVASDAGIELHAYVKGATWGDANGDGWPDLYVSVLGGANRLYLNQGGNDGPTFVDVASQAGVRAPLYSFSTWFWDYDNDGDDDLFVSGYDARYLMRVPVAVAAEYVGADLDVELPRLYRNDTPPGGEVTFTDVTEEQGLDTVLFAMGANYGDLDNDGFLDFYAGTGAPDLRSLVPNRMFRNDEGSGFSDVTFSGGFGHIQKGHAVAFADFDRDGDQDVYSVMGGAIEGDVFQNVLFENPGHDNHWITLRLEGRTANRAAIGARVKIVARRPDGSTRSLYRRVGTGGSFGASSLQQEIGLGDATRIDTLQVTWPNAQRTTDTYTGVDVDQTLRVVEDGGVEPLDRPPVPFREQPATDATHHHAASTSP